MPLPSRERMLEFFKEKCGPHLDPDIELKSYDDLLESYLKELFPNDQTKLSM